MLQEPVRQVLAIAAAVKALFSLAAVVVSILMHTSCCISSLDVLNQPSGRGGPCCQADMHA